MPRGPEAKVKKWVGDFIKRRLTGVYLRNIHQSMYSNKGIPDILGCYGGVFFAIEVKTESGSTTKLQDLEIQNIRATDGVAIVIYGKDEELLDKFVKVMRDKALILKNAK